MVKSTGVLHANRIRGIKAMILRTHGAKWKEIVNELGYAGENNARLAVTRTLKYYFLPPMGDVVKKEHKEFAKYAAEKIQQSLHGEEVPNLPARWRCSI